MDSETAGTRNGHDSLLSEAPGMTSRTMRLVKACVFIFCTLLTIYYLASEKVPVNDGYGWDGLNYAHLVGNLDDDLHNKKISSYYVQRILPSFVVSIPARLFDVPVTRDYIISGFVAANALCLYLASFLWLKICAAMKMEPGRTIASYILLFGFYWIIKGAAYYPVLTDMFAFTLSIAMIYFYVNNRLIGLSAALLAGMFTWPSTVFTGTFLLLFPFGSKLTISRRCNTFMRPLISISAAALMAALIVYVVLIKAAYHIRGAAVDYDLLPISFTLVLVYVYCIASLSVESLAGEAKGIRLVGMRFGWVLAWLFLIIGCLAVQRSLSGFSDSGLTVWGHAKGCVVRPLLYLVGDVTYYGAAAILLLIGLKRVLKACHELGLGIFLVVVFSLALNLYPESRMIISGFPFAVLGIAKAFPFHRLTPKQWSLLILVQLLCSKVWLKIGATADDYLRLDTYPAQYYFMNHGPWMGQRAYLVQMGLALVMLAAFYHFFSNRAFTAEDRY